MKYAAFTFDDGRSDNYSLVKHIMESYRFRGTVYITTGFIDGTWVEKDVLRSPSDPLTVDEIKALYDSGWEIGLHGDKHQTTVADMRSALEKLQQWGIQNDSWGISIPNSRVSETEINALFESDYGEKIAYIRRGRACDTVKLKNKVLYGLSSVLKSKWAYRRFNAENVFLYGDGSRTNIPSVVVKSTNTAEQIADFVRALPDNTAVVLMLHSILAAEHPLCGKDPWSWDKANFEKLCSAFSDMTEAHTLSVLPLMELIQR